MRRSSWIRRGEYTMKRFINNLSTNAKLVISFATILVLMAAVIITAYLSLTDFARSEKTLNDNHFQVNIMLEQIKNHENYNRSQVLDMMLSSVKTDQSALEQLIRARSLTIDALLAKLITLDPDPVFQSDLQILKNEIVMYRQTRDNEIALIYAGKNGEAILLGNGLGADQFEVIRLKLVDMVAAATAKTDGQIAVDQQRMRSTISALLILGAFTVLLTIGLVVILNRTIAKPLMGIARIAERIGAGDLTVKVSDDQRRDEIGSLTQAFRQMADTLRRSLTDLSDTITQLGSSASEILAATTQMAAGTAVTATSINETTTTVEEVRQATQLSSQKAQNVSDSAQRVDQVSLSGQKAVAEALEGMEHIREQMETIAQTVVRLSEQSQSIGGIVASVTDIADQSNLLAVNAAIEAAKAGEQGKGFAVVAQEIKSLAEQSKQATAEVRSILNDVQKATGNSVMATEQGSKAVAAGMKQAEQAGTAIMALAETSGEAVQAAVQIVASSQQQVVGMDQIGVAMENINQTGAQNASSMRQMELAAQNLHQLGEKLKVLVAQFKV